MHHNNKNNNINKNDLNTKNTSTSILNNKINCKIST